MADTPTSGGPPEIYREPFSRSLSIRDRQHARTEAYLDALWSEAPSRRARAFRPIRRSGRAHERSMASHRRRLARMLGCPPPHALAPRIVRSELVGEARAYTVRRVWVEVCRSLDAYGILLDPRRARGRPPLLVAIHGGGGCPEAVCDLDTRENYASLGPRAALAGWAVWAPSLLMRVSYGDDPPREHDRYWLDRRARAVGASIVGLEVHQIIAGIRALSREADVDPGRVCMAGLSYGGYYTLLATALCPAVRAAVCSGFFGSFTELPAAEDRLFPGLLNVYDMSELAALICPRPLMIQNGRNDTVIPVDGARREYGNAAAWYRGLGLDERLVWHEHQGGHDFVPDSILSFLDAWGEGGART